MRSQLSAPGHKYSELLLEALCLAIPGCLLGLAVSFAGTSVFRHAAVILPACRCHLDWRIVAFTVSISMLTALLFGLIPALRSTRSEVAGTWAHGLRSQIGGRHRIQRILVSAQIALAIVLLIGSSLLIRSLARLTQVSWLRRTRARVSHQRQLRWKLTTC